MIAAADANGRMENKIKPKNNKKTKKNYRMKEDENANTLWLIKHLVKYVLICFIITIRHLQMQWMAKSWISRWLIEQLS